MTLISKPTIPLTALALFLMLATTVVHSQDVTSFTYDTFDLIYQGGAHVPEGSQFLRLTQTDSSGNPLSWNAGRVIKSLPVLFWEKSPALEATFETTIKFRITPSLRGAADGLVFFIAPPNTNFGNDSSGANFGIFNKSAGGIAKNVFAVEFDTNANEWDPRYRHIGIDIESRVSKSTVEFNSATGQEVTARIDYNPNTKTITVVAVSGSQKATVSYVFDLKTILPGAVEVGISSSTGNTMAELGVHDLISWYFTSSLVRDDAYIRQIV